MAAIAPAYGRLRRLRRRTGIVARVLIVALFANGCRQSVSTQIVPIAFSLPRDERLTYRIQTDTEVNLGRVELSVAASGSTLKFSTLIDAGGGRMNSSEVLVDLVTLLPLRVRRTVSEGGRNFQVQERYDGGVLMVNEQGSTGEHHRRQRLPESAYDDQESLFLWRTLQFTPGYTVRYVDVVVNPETGAISRPVGTVHVAFKEQIQLPQGPVTAWKVEYGAAGFQNIAWYEDGPLRRLVKYSIPAQQITYYLAGSQ